MQSEFTEEKKIMKFRGGVRVRRETEVRERDGAKGNSHWIVPHTGTATLDPLRIQVPNQGRKEGREERGSQQAAGMRVRVGTSPREWEREGSQLGGDAGRPGSGSTHRPTEPVKPGAEGAQHMEKGSRG